jgi:hapalindole-type alkaloid chlorinase
MVKPMTTITATPALNPELRSDSLFELRDLRPADLGACAGTLDDIIAARIAGVVVRGLYPPASMAMVNRRIEEGEADDVLFASEASIHSGAYRQADHYYGLNLVNLQHCSVGWPGYLDYARRFRLRCASLFRALPDFEAVLARTFGSLDGQRRIAVPCSTDGVAYTPATIRVFPQGKEIRPHCGNRFMKVLADYAHLRALSDGSDQLSYFLVIRTAASGGQLVLYDCLWDTGHVGMIEDTVTAPLDVIAASRWQAVPVKPGDLVLFNGGRIYHSITRIESPDCRRTIGGFLSRSADGETTFFYS